MTKRTLAIDFDDTLHDTKHTRWTGIGKARGSMISYAAKHLHDLSKDYKIVIYSCRAVHPDGVEAIRKFCVRNNIPFDAITATKPIAALYIDDKALQFTTWAETVRQIRKRLKK